MDNCVHQCQPLCIARVRVVFFMTGMIASVVLAFHTFMLLSRNDFSALSPSDAVYEISETRLPSSGISPKSTGDGKLSLLSDSHNSTYLSINVKESEKAEVFNISGPSLRGSIMDEITRDTIDEDVLNNDIGPDDYAEFGSRFMLNHEDGMPREVSGTAVDFNFDHILDNNFTSLEMVRGQDNYSTFFSNVTSAPDITVFVERIESTGKESVANPLTSDSVFPDTVLKLASVTSATDLEQPVPLSGGQTNVLSIDLLPVRSDSAPVNTNHASVPLVRKRIHQVLAPVRVSEMKQLLLRNRASDHLTRPRRSSARDKDILAAKLRIKNAPILKNEHELYAPLFQNISLFKRSYDLMERVLKVYIYTEGKKPIFHHPLLKGIYASEGWFMKMMKTSRHFVVKDPRRAHLFYMPFSSRNLQLALYVPNSHNMRNLRQHLKNYVDLLARKYPFWNRTGGADHFLVACHDWSPYETKDTMGNSIRALCNADLNNGFQLGKDVSVPETYVRSAQNPLRDLGGMPADKRPTLAFYAGNMHGTLRPILVQYWENKHPDIKISGPMPPGVENRMIYIEHMKTSKYCICPRGYEVNSPRVVESIFYECVPVIISDNFVPPLLEVLNWEAFSVILLEKDVPRLKEILESIPEEKYLALQMAVRNVQKHFLWHRDPVKYDLFHMILHSIWFNRVYQVR